MNTDEVIAQFDQYVVANYGRLADVIVKGEGSTITDDNDKTYIDMFPGWGVSGIGHCHPKVVAAIKAQAETLIHIDNTFYNKPQGHFAQLLSERAFGGKLFFSNSGAESIEGAIKLARLATDSKKYKIITCQGGFHGRTLGAITATAQPKYHAGFMPLLPGFTYIPFNDVEALKAAFDDETCGVLVEPIQGEGGINLANIEFLQTIRDLCDANNAVAIWDEVQCGMGRTGKWFGYQHYGIEPDIMTMAKSLGGGVAIGAMMCKAHVANYLKPGTHASTFGGNPLACAAGIAVIEAIEEENLLENSISLGQYLTDKLNALKEKHCVIEQIRGKGVMIAVQLNNPGGQVVSTCWENGLRINCTQDSVLRIMPAMNCTEALIDSAIKILDNALTVCFSEVENNV